MAHAGSLGQRCALIAFLAPLLLVAEQAPAWEQHLQAGIEAFAAGRYAQAVESLTDAVQDAQAFPLLDLRRADTAQLLGMSYQFQGKFNRAEPLLLDARSIREANGESGRALLGGTLDALGQLRFEQERWSDAEELERQAIQLCHETSGDRDPCTLTANRHLGEIYSTQGRLTEAETIFQQVIDAARQSRSAGPRLLAATLRDEALVVIAQGQYRRAE